MASVFKRAGRRKWLIAYVDEHGCRRTGATTGAGGDLPGGKPAGSAAGRHAASIGKARPVGSVEQNALLYAEAHYLLSLFTPRQLASALPALRRIAEEAGRVDGATPPPPMAGPPRLTVHRQ